MPAFTYTIYVFTVLHLYICSCTLYIYSPYVLVNYALAYTLPASKCITYAFTTYLLRMCRHLSHRHLHVFYLHLQYICSTHIIYMQSHVSQIHLHILYTYAFNVIYVVNVLINNWMYYIGTYMYYMCIYMYDIGT
jgi:hypothetical protein